MYPTDRPTDEEKYREHAPELCLKIPQQGTRGLSGEYPHFKRNRQMFSLRRAGFPLVCFISGGTTQAVAARARLWAVCCAG